MRYDKQFVDQVEGGESGKKCGILLDNSCFYAEQGGQMCDTGYMNAEGNEVRSQILFLTFERDRKFRLF